MSVRAWLVRHAEPEVDRASRAREWPLSSAGWLACRELAGRLALPVGVHLYASAERKAIESAEAFRAAGGPAPAITEGLEEHHAGEIPWMVEEEFQGWVSQAFAAPQLVPPFAAESLSAAGTRLGRTLLGLLEADPHDTLVAVSHGRAMASFLASVSGQDGLTVWRALRMPCAVPLSYQAGDLRWSSEIVTTDGTRTR
jgi:broad specificity phosphatase PhoE